MGERESAARSPSYRRTAAAPTLRNRTGGDKRLDGKGLGRSAGWRPIVSPNPARSVPQLEVRDDRESPQVPPLLPMRFPISRLGSIEICIVR
jgi:hypothetical protein